MEIAAEMGVEKWIVFNYLKKMRYNKDPELKQAYIDKELRAHENKLSRANLRDAKFHHMAGMTLQQRNFENMINYYKDELQVIFKSQDEYTAIAGLSKTVRNTLALNKITTGWGRNNQLTAKARGYLLLDN
ncbi:hypothetical protein A3K78_06215 [Candidatus Bathyarchaeota archaeon RBG_13_52_12]|nr:MAG: hypothetical protein A3K78_06215 [Candidatus Bathyarchaeota archaeon RBG_13_52_12]